LTKNTLLRTYLEITEAVGIGGDKQPTTGLNGIAHTKGDMAHDHGEL